MAYFRFRRLETTGELTGGVVKLPFREISSAIAHLERNGGSAIYVKKLGRLSTFLVQVATYRPQKKLGRSFQAEFLRVVALMLRAGMILTTALHEAASSTERPEFERIVEEIVMSIQGGNSFSEALAKFPGFLPTTAVHLIRIGEETGKLDEMLMDAAEHLARIQSIISDTKQALMYPSFVFVSLTAAMVFWFYYVVPKIKDLFREMDVALPTITVYLLAISAWVQAWFFQVLTGTILAVLAVVLARKHIPRFKWLTDALLLDLPLVGSIISASTLAFISEYFHILMNAGIDLLQSLNILKDSLNNAIYREKIGEVRDSVRQGNGIADAFAATLIFPAFVVRMIHTGEISGTLTTQLAYIAENYRRSLSLLVATIGKLIEPVVLVVAGVIFAVIIGGLMLPIYDLVSRVSR